jgi:hypothetical protein
MSDELALRHSFVSDEQVLRPGEVRLVPRLASDVAILEQQVQSRRFRRAGVATS